MSANTIITSIVTGGSNNHATVSEEANSIATDFVTQGVVGAITLNSGSGGTGSFCVNADASPDMGITIKAGQAYITATPSSQDSQVLRARASTDYTTYTINSNSSGSTKFDWIYLMVNATNANNPAADASNVTSIFTSRSSSNATDNGSPPTYGLLLAVVTVANAASSITNSNITDKRFNTSIGAQNGSLIVTQSATGQDAILQAAGVDANVNLNLKPKGTGRVILNGAGAGAHALVATSQTTNSGTYGDLGTAGPAVTVTIGNSGMAIIAFSAEMFNGTSGDYADMSFVASGANTITVGTDPYRLFVQATGTNIPDNKCAYYTVLTGLSAGSTVFTCKYRTIIGGTATFVNREISVIPL